MLRFGQGALVALIGAISAIGPPRRNDQHRSARERLCLFRLQHESGRGGLFRLPGEIYSHVNSVPVCMSYIASGRPK